KLEAHALDRVGELDVDAEVVGIELERVARAQAALLVHVHLESGDRAVDAELPVAVAVGGGLEPHGGKRNGGCVDGVRQAWSPLGRAAYCLDRGGQAKYISAMSSVAGSPRAPLSSGSAPRAPLLTALGRRV